MRVIELIRRLETLPQDALVVGVWYDETDIILAAKDMDINLTRAELEAVVEELEEYHDAEYGITWQLIRDTIRKITGR